MAGPAIVSIHIVRCLDGRGACLHGERDVHVTEPAGELRPMEPVIEYNRRETRFFRGVVQDDLSIFRGQRPFLFYACLRYGYTSNSENQQHDE